MLGAFLWQLNWNCQVISLLLQHFPAPIPDGNNPPTTTTTTNNNDDNTESSQDNHYYTSYYPRNIARLLDIVRDYLETVKAEHGNEESQRHQQRVSDAIFVSYQLSHLLLIDNDHQNEKENNSMKSSDNNNDDEDDSNA